MTELKQGEYRMHTSKNGIEYQVQNKGGKIVMVNWNSAWGFKILKASKEVSRLFKAV